MAEVAANPFAIEKIRAKTPVGSPLNSAEWADVPLALLERAQISSEIERIRMMQRIQERITSAVSMARRPEGAFQSREKFVAELAKIAREEGLDPRNSAETADRAGTLRDPTSSRRLRLIYDIQRSQAQEYARWRAEQDPDVLDAYPAQEFIRIQARKVPRIDWRERWKAAGGKIIEGRMVALKSDPVWSKLNRFGVPYPPFDFGSGMGLKDLGRQEAERLGLIKPGEKPEPSFRKFNDDLQASVQDLSPTWQAHLQDTFGEQIEIKDGFAKWRGNLIADLFDVATSDPQYKGRVKLGKMSPRAVAAVKAATEEDLTGWEFDLAADDIRHAMGEHGPLGENREDQRPLRRADFEALPHVLREPDVARQGDKAGTLELTKDFGNGNQITVWVQRSAKNRRANLKTMWAKK